MNALVAALGNAVALMPWSSLSTSRWMLGALLFAALCAIAALLVEIALRALGRPTRLVWAGALLLAACWPLIAPLVLVASTTTAIPDAATVGASVIAGVPEEGATSLAASVLARLDLLLAGVWFVATSVLLVQMLRAVRTLRAVRRRARVAEVDGTTVLVDRDVGPAVIGVVQPRIVCPEWVLQLDEPLRALVLRHEREHCRVRDPLLVWLSAVVTTMLPWNAALWWMARRLRLAMEIDCDARTLSGTTERARYARLLLLIAQQGMSARFAPALTNPPSLLTRRIRAMHTSPVPHAPLRAIIAGCLALVAMGSACSSRIASNLTSPAPASATAARSTSDASAVSNAAASTTAPYSATSPTTDDSDVFMAPGSAGPRYPAALLASRVTGRVMAQFIVGADGRADPASLMILQATAPEFVAAVREALPEMRFLPARKDGVAVRKLHQQPFMFALSAKEAMAMTVPPRTTATAPTSDKPFFDFQVDAPVTMRKGSVGPAYPQTLRAAKVQGTVLMQVVIDETGRPDMTTFKILRSDHALFSDAVLTAMSTIQWEPATANGKAVKQLLQQPFQFAVPDQ